MHTRYRFCALLLALLAVFLFAACQSAVETPEQPGNALPQPETEQPEVRPEPDAEPGSDVESEPDAEPGSDVEPEPDAEPGSDVEPEPDAEPEPNVESNSEAEAESDAEPEKPTEKNHTLYILMYHNITEGDGAGLDDWTITTDRLRADLQWLTDHGYTFYFPSEIIDGTPLAEKAVLLTFDDGYASNYTLGLPILREFGAKAVISVICERVDDGVDGFLTWDMCRELADSGLVELGSHTYDFHRAEPLGILRADGESREDYEARMFPDLLRSIERLEEETGQTVRFFAFPFGRTDPWASDFLREHFSMTVTTNHGPADISDGLYDLRRCNISLREPPSKFLP